MEHVSTYFTFDLRQCIARQATTIPDVLWMPQHSVNRVITTAHNVRTLTVRSLAVRNAGYSLLEVLFTISLLTILVSAITVVSGHFVKFSQSRAESSTSWKLALGTLEDLRLDLRATTSELEVAELLQAGRKKSKPSSDGLGSPFESSRMATERFLRADMQAPQQFCRFAGDPTAIFLMRYGKNPRFPESEHRGWRSASGFTASIAPTQGNERASQWHSIVWIAPGYAEARLPILIRGNSVQSLAITRPAVSKQSGANRREFSSGFVRIDNLDSTPRISGGIDEVQRLGFRYWDGSAWRTHWNSFDEGGSLPRAVEVTLSLKSSPERVVRQVILLNAASHDAGGYE